MVKKTTPATLTFDKEMFKKNVMYNVKTLYRKTLEEATPQQIFQAVAYTVKDTIIDNWLETQQEYEKKDPKTVYYLSMEFLMGRALGNDLINLQEYKPVKEALEELGLDLNVIEDQEPDAALPQIFIPDEILVRNCLNVVIPFHILRKLAELLCNFTVELRFRFRILQVIVSLQDTQFEEKAVLCLVNPLLELFGSLVLNEFIRILIRFEI